MLIITWLIFSILVAVLADNWGRSGFGYFLLSIVLSPLIGILVLAISGKNSDELEKAQITNNKLTKCPFCKELVKPDAVKCKHCGSDIASHTQSLESKVTKLIEREEISLEEKQRLASINKKAWIFIGVAVVLVVLMDSYFNGSFWTYLFK
jgi:ribosomal protein L37AE/L43A